ncbi:MAG: alanine racemase [bacterium]|nr:alanine racemase [bacterium]
MPVPGQLWAEIDLDAIAHNVRQLVFFLSAGRERPPLLMAVVKADAYGYGAVTVARVALAAGARWLGVSTVPEAMELREAGLDAPILVFNPPLEEEMDLYPEYALTATAAGAAVARRLGPACHLKVDTGFGRFGVTPGEAEAILQEAATGGVYTHLGAHRPRLLARRFAPFRSLLERLTDLGRRPPLAHAAASAAILLCPDTHLDLVRAGNLIYGLWPEGRPRPGLDLRPAWRLRARLVALHDVLPGSATGYGGERRLPRGSRVAVVPAGFADGLGLEPLGRLERSGNLARHLARAVLGRLGMRLSPANGAVEIRGRLAPRVGRPGMAHTVVDVTGFAGLAVGEEVTLHARRTTVNARVPRLYLKGGRPAALRAGTGILAAGSRDPVAAGTAAVTGEA